MSPEKLVTIREWAAQESSVTLPAKTVLALLEMAEPLEGEAVRIAHKALVREAVLKERRRERQRCLEAVDVEGEECGMLVVREAIRAAKASIRERIEEGP